MSERDRLNGIVECPCEQCRRRSDEAKEKTMKLPPELKRAMERLDQEMDVTDDQDMANAARDLLKELWRYEKKLEETTKDVGVSTHALARVQS